MRQQLLEILLKTKLISFRTQSTLLLTHKETHRLQTGLSSVTRILRSSLNSLSSWVRVASGRCSRHFTKRQVTQWLSKSYRSHKRQRHLRRRSRSLRNARAHTLSSTMEATLRTTTFGSFWSIVTQGAWRIWSRSQRRLLTKLRSQAYAKLYSGALSTCTIQRRYTET